MNLRSSNWQIQARFYFENSISRWFEIIYSIDSAFYHWILLMCARM